MRFLVLVRRLFPAAILLLAAISASGQTGLDRPHMGILLDPSGAVRALFGVPGSLLVGDTLATGALSIACSRRRCLVKTDLAILSSTGAVPAPAGPALFALNGETALIYFPASKQLARWNAGRLDFLDVSLPEEVLSLRNGGGNMLHAAVRHDRGVSLLAISLADGSISVTGSIPYASVVMLLDQGVLFSDREGLVLRHSDGTELRFELRGAEAAFVLWDEYVEVRAAGSEYAVRVDPGHEQIFLLPGGVK